MNIFNFLNRPRWARELKRLAKENQGKPLNLLDDVVFKIMLSSKSDDSQEALRSLLSACTRRKVSSVQVINNELTPSYLGGKSPRLDVHVTFNDGETADLEMQTSKSNDDLRKRAEFYTAMLLAGQLPKGGHYKNLKRVYQVFFLNFELFPGRDRFARRYFYQEEIDHDRLSETSEIIFYELPKLEKRLRSVLDGSIGIENLTVEEEWCIYLKYRHEKRAASLIAQLCEKEEGIMQAEQTVKKVSRDYIKYVRKMADIKNRIDRASALDYAREEGLREGEKKERQRFIELLDQGLSVEEIKRRL